MTLQNLHMADVSLKPETMRIATASGCLHMGSEAFAMLSEKRLPKGDAFVVAEIAGILGTKNTAQIIPLCHPLQILSSQLSFELLPATLNVQVYCTVTAYARTGVEMEALAGVTTALLCLYDLIKPVDPKLDMHNIVLLKKEGGKSGVWTRN